MSGELPPDVTVEETADGIRYVLPRAAFGVAWLFGVPLAAFGLAPMAMGGFFIASSFEHIARFQGVAAVGTLLMLLCPLLFILFGSLLSLVGVWCLVGRAEIVVSPHEISSAFRLGPLAWRGRRGRTQVRRLVAERSSAAGEPASALASLYAETDVGRPLLLALMYPNDWLVALAAAIADRAGTEADPLPIVERVARKDSSRRWRRDQSASVKGQGPGAFLAVWGLLFFGAGTLCFVLILQSLLRGDPGNNLEGAWPWKILWILFPIPFLIPGAGALVYAYRRRATAGLSPEQIRAADAARKPPRDEAGVVALSPAEGEAEYPTVPKMSGKPGNELTARLGPDLSPGVGVALLLGVLVICSGIITPLVMYVVSSLRAGNRDAVPTLGFISVFLGLFWVLIAVKLAKEWRLWALGPLTVELSALALYCGETYKLLVVVGGPARYQRLRVTLVCEEQASYTEGTTTRTETRRVYEKELALQEDLLIEKAASFRVQASFDVPAAAMHSFKAGHNEVRWVVRLEGLAARALSLQFTHDYPLAVRPPRDHGSKM